MHLAAVSTNVSGTSAALTCQIAQTILTRLSPTHQQKEYAEEDEDE